MQSIVTDRKEYYSGINKVTEKFKEKRIKRRFLKRVFVNKSQNK